MKTTLLEQIRKRRLALGIKIQDMPLLAGLTRQQYGKIEARGNPRLSSLDQIAEGLDSALVLVPKNRLADIERMLSGGLPYPADRPPEQVPRIEEQDIEADASHENPWRDL